MGWFGISLETSLVAISAASFVIIACGLYGLVRVATESIFAGAIAALLLVSANAFWAYVLLGGLYPRILGMAFISLFAFFAVLHLKTGSVPAHAAAVLSLAGALSSHLLLGAIGVALAVLIVAVLSRRRLLDGARLLVPAALLVAYFYVPYLAGLTRPAPVPLFTREYLPVPIDALLNRNPRELEAISILATGIAVVVPPVVYFGRRFVLPPLARQLMPAMAVGGVGALVYALVGLPLPHLYIYNFQPGQALFFAAWFLAGLIGLTVTVAAGPRVPRFILPMIAFGLLGVVAFGPTRLSLGVINADNSVQQRRISALHVDQYDRQYRIGVESDAQSAWIDARYDVPQTRGYQQQGVVSADWQYWLENRLWSADANFDEKNFMLDWYAIRSFYGGTASGTFAARPDLYAPQDASGQTFDFVNAGPIMSARGTRTALVIGSDAGYSNLIRAVAISDFDSRSFIPLRGGAYVDDLSASELRRFDMVVLYEFQAHDLEASFRLLDDYVLGGGNLLIEASNSPTKVINAAPPPIPGSSVTSAQVVRDWRLAPGVTQITTGVELGAFDPAVYNGGPWTISYIPASAIASWAAPVLLSDGRPVVVAGTLGKGRVVWSGLNLPFHVATTRNPEESRLLASEVRWAAPGEAVAPAYSAEFVNPQLRRVVVESPAGGVLFKENYVANWQATVNGRAAPIYRAGPDFMYVALGSEVAYPATVVFAFTRTAAEWLGDAISLAAAVGFVVWLVRSSSRGSRRRRLQRR